MTSQLIPRMNWSSFPLSNQKRLLPSNILCCYITYCVQSPTWDDEANEKEDFALQTAAHKAAMKDLWHIKYYTQLHGVIIT